MTAPFSVSPAKPQILKKSAAFLFAQKRKGGDGLCTSLPAAIGPLNSSMQGKPGFDHYDSGEAVTPEDCGTCRFYRPHWKYQFCVYAECPYQPGKLTAYDAVRFRVKGVENMAVFRVERNKGYTVMSNHHLRNKDLSLKAKGLLSQMLSLPENWDYTVTLNDLEDEPPRNPVTKLLLCMFIPFYAIYWFYRSAQSGWTGWPEGRASRRSCRARVCCWRSLCPLRRRC